MGIALLRLVCSKSVVSRPEFVKLGMVAMGAFALPAGFVLLISHFSPDSGLSRALGGAIVIGATSLIVFPFKSLLAGPLRGTLTRVRNHLLFALCTLCLLPLFAVLNLCSLRRGTWVGWLALFSVLWGTVGGWIVIIHLIGLILSVGRRLPLGRRLALYYVLASALAVPACVVASQAMRVRDILFSILAVIALVGILGVADFRRFPRVEEQSQYDPLAKKLARLIDWKQ